MFGRHREKPPVRSEGTAARERAEEALDDIRRRKAAQAPLRRWFRSQYESNHFGEDVEKLWGARR